MAVTNNALAPWYMQGGSTVVTKGEVARRAREILEGADYVASLTRRIKSDDLPAAVEVMLWHYAYGKPVETLNVNVSQEEDLAALSLEQLVERAKRIQDQLEEAKSLEQAIPAEYRVA